jgi:glycosyltransferase involved in cell wall biosynthesis
LTTDLIQGAQDGAAGIQTVPINSHRRLKLLLLVAGCDGTDVGEAWSSFQWVSQLKLRHDVTVLTFKKRDKPSAVAQLPGVRVIEWVDLPVIGKWERFNSMFKPGYISFYFRARRWLKEYLRSGETFDLAHQISPLALRYPSPAAGLGIPLIVGPLGGSIETPKAFQKELNGSPWYVKLRGLDRWRLKHDPLLRQSYAYADLLICVAPYVEELLVDLPPHETELLSETGMTHLPPPRLPTRGDNGVLRLLFVGRVIRTKGVRDAIRAVASIKDISGLRFDVVGDGDDLAACKKEAHELKVDDVVTFHGKLPRAEVAGFYAKADVFVFPSFREPSGNAVIEAMSHGLPLIVADQGGPGFVVDDDCGFRIPVEDPQKFASRIASAIRELASAPNRIISMGSAAREKVERKFLWEAKADRMTELYEKVLVNRRDSKS